jgi:hypothetical protein
MNAQSQAPRQALKRLLANGPLTGLPTRRGDIELLLELAAARFAPGRAYSEKEVNEVLKAWLATFCAPHGIDHVSMRRHLADAGLLVRDRSGAEYRLNARRLGEAPDLQPAEVLAAMREERAARKRRQGLN